MNGDELGWNKIFGAILATALLIVGLKQAAEMIYAPHPPAKMGDLIAVAEDTSGGGEAKADTPPDWGTVLPAANVSAGQEVSTKCASCHTFTPGGPNGTGPNNYGVIGRKPGSKEGFAYSSAMTDFGSKHAAWDYDQLYLFLANPGSYISGTKMSFVGLKKPEDRINLIAWLRQQSTSPAAIPAPDPKKAAAAAGTGDAKAAAGAPAPAAGAKVGETAKGAPAAGAPVASAGGNATGTAGQTGSGAAAAPRADKTAPGAPPK
jgi:cytochrome c